MNAELAQVLIALAFAAGGTLGVFAARSFGSDTARAVNGLKVAVARVKAAKARVDQEQGALLAQVPEIVKGL